MMSSQSGSIVLIDGYNVIKKHPQWSEADLEHGRATLLAAVRRMRWSIPVREIHVFFDSREPQEDGGRRMQGSVRVVFAVSADAEICAAIRNSARADRLVVISSDNEIRSSAKSHGAVWRTAAWFHAQLAPRAAVQPRTRGSSAPPAPKRELTPIEQRRITDELRRRFDIHDE